MPILPFQYHTGVGEVSHNTTEILFNKTVTDLPDLRPLTTSAELLTRCQEVVVS